MKVFTKNNLFIVLFFVGLFGSFSYGILVGRFKIFPYELLKSSWESNSAIKGTVGSSMGNVIGDQDGYSIETNLLILDVEKHNVLGEAGITGDGGAITTYNGTVFGVDREGQFFVYEKGGTVKKLAISIDTNKEPFREKLSGYTFTNTHIPRNIDRFFRFMDIEVAAVNGNEYLIVSHHYWDEASEGKRFRVSRLLLDDIPSIVNGKEVSASDWEVIYESDPPITFGEPPHSAINTNHTGGRMFVEEDGHLLVGTGEHRYDGIRYPYISAQDINSPYGKILRINIETLENEVFALGIRNPQGLFKDRDGNIWETEHGPRGGDELNLIRQGVNYGWPLVTYGTDELSFVWPHSSRQGSHEGYQMPIHSWVPSIGISNLIQVNNSPAEWDGDILMASLKNLTLYRLRIRENRVVVAEPITVGERVRDLVQMDDGSFLVFADNGVFIEITPNLSDLNNNLDDLLMHEERELGLGPIIQECAVCHSFRESYNPAGAPTLHKVYGRAIGNSNFEGYSSALRSVGGTWDEASLQAYLQDTQAFAPGSTMPAQGITDPQQLDALVNFLKRLE